MTYLSADNSHICVCTFKNKNAEESFKEWLAYSAIKFVVKQKLQLPWQRAYKDCATLQNLKQ